MTTQKLREPKKLKTRFLYLSDSVEPTTVTDVVTWYDARAANPTRTEYRLYYPSNNVMEYAKSGDLLIIGKRPDGLLVLMVIESDSTIESQVLWLFEESRVSDKFAIRSFVTDSPKKLDFVARMILEQIGVEVKITDDTYLDTILSKFGNKFPTTKAFSRFARETIAITLPYNPDKTILAWMEREELLFRTLEQYLVNERLIHGFSDTDSFIRVALSIINRRKARAGLALENHLEQIFLDYDISYSRGAKTERKSKPDFLFPNICVYRIPEFPSRMLTMLGVKTTCKDRWRQVLHEATRIQEKHLLTLEPSISSAQIQEMKDRKLQLVIPSPIHITFSEQDRSWLWDMESFLDFVKNREHNSHHEEYC